MWKNLALYKTIQWMLGASVGKWRLLVVLSVEGRSPKWWGRENWGKNSTKFFFFFKQWVKTAYFVLGYLIGRIENRGDDRKSERIEYRRKSHFRSYIFRQFSLWSIDFIFTTFSFYPKKRFPFWFLSLHQRQKMHTGQTAKLKNIKIMSTWLSRP